MRYGHPNTLVMKDILDWCGKIYFNKDYIHNFYDACQLEKTHKLDFDSFETKCTQLLELIHTFLWDASFIHFNTNSRYYITFIDDFSKFTWMYSFKTESQALKVFKFFKTKIESQLNFKIKTLQSDCSSEYRPFSLTLLLVAFILDIPTLIHTIKALVREGIGIS